MTHAIAPALSNLIHDFIHDATLLVRQHIALLQAELGETAAEAIRHVVKLVVAAVLVVAGLLVLLAFAVIGLAALGLPWWAASLIVAVATLLAAVTLGYAGARGLRATTWTPRKSLVAARQTMASIRGQQ